MDLNKLTTITINDGLVNNSNSSPINYDTDYQLDDTQRELLQDISSFLSLFTDIQLGEISIATIDLKEIIDNIFSMDGYSNSERIILNQLRTWFRFMR